MSEFLNATEFTPQAEYHAPRYDLVENEVKQLENELLDISSEISEEPGVACVWITPYSKYANLVRTHEASYFPEVGDLEEEDEAITTFFALVDTRPSVKRVVHAGAITGVSYDPQNKELIIKPQFTDTKTGFCTVDELIQRGNFSANDFYEYYKEQGIDPLGSIAVETNFRVGDKAERFNGFGTAEIAYKGIFSVFERKAELGRSVMFATINQATMDSFKRVGISYEPLMGRTDMKTPEAELGKDSLPIAIYYDEQSSAIFQFMSFKTPEIVV